MTKVAVVTGASRGIGERIASRLAADGYAVACTATRRAHVEPVAARISRQTQQTAIAVEMRVEESDAGHEAMANVETLLGPIDLLVNNAGIGHVAPFDQMHIDDFAAVMKVNVGGVFVCGQAVAQRMISAGGGGVIINIGSIAGVNAFPGRAGYCPSKAAVHHLTRVMAIDLARHAIRVNAVAPGYVRTDLVDELIDAGALDEGTLEHRVPMGVLGTPNDVAAAVAWLASDEARYITGEVLTVDGGWVAYGHV